MTRVGEALVMKVLNKRVLFRVGELVIVHPRHTSLEGCQKLLEGGVVSLKVYEDVEWETDSDAGSEFQLSDIDARNDFLGFEEREDLLESDESEEEDISFDEGRGRVPTSHRSRR